MAKPKAQTHQTNEYNCHIPDVVQAFYYVEHVLITLETKSTNNSNIEHFIFQVITTGLD